jgi:hypothetical protein
LWLKKEEGNEIGETKQRGKGTKKLMAIMSDNTGIPITIHITSVSSHHEVTTLTEATISRCFITTNEKLKRLIGDKTYDSDPLDEKLAIEYGIGIISPHRGGWRRKRLKKTQEGVLVESYKDQKEA